MLNDTPPQSLPDSVIGEAWSEFLYPRAAVGDLAEPHPQSGFTRAVRVFQGWATEHDAYWHSVADAGLASQRTQIRNAMQPLIERIRSVATAHSDPDDVARAAAELMSEFADSLIDPGASGTSGVTPK
jgi:hypothetical protein